MFVVLILKRLIHEKKIDDYIDFHKNNGGTGKIFNFKLVHYVAGSLELEGDFTEICLNPDGSVQGGMMTAMLDDVTSLLIIAETNGEKYPASTDLHTLHHRPMNQGKVKAKASIIKMGKRIATSKGEIYDGEQELIATLMHTSYLIKKLII